MDPKAMKKMLIPAAVVAGVIVLLALFTLIKPGEASSKAGRKIDVASLSDMPPKDAKEWKDIVNGGGLRIWDVKTGEGPEVLPGANVKVHYTGWRAHDGFIFDSSVKRGEPISFSLDRVIQGWTKGIPGMKVGGIRRLYIPSELGYGERGSGANIPPNTDLIFEVELLGIN